MEKLRGSATDECEEYLLPEFGKLHVGFPNQLSMRIGEYAITGERSSGFYSFMAETETPNHTQFLNPHCQGRRGFANIELLRLLQSELLYFSISNQEGGKL